MKCSNIVGVPNRGTNRGEQKGCSNYDNNNITTSTYNLSTLVLRLFHVTVCNKNQLLAIPPHPSHQACIIFNQEGQGIYRRCCCYASALHVRAPRSQECVVCWFVQNSATPTQHFSTQVQAFSISIAHVYIVVVVTLRTWWWNIHGLFMEHSNSTCFCLYCATTQQLWSTLVETTQPVPSTSWLLYVTVDAR